MIFELKLPTETSEKVPLQRGALLEVDSIEILKIKTDSYHVKYRVGWYLNEEHLNKDNSKPISIRTYEIRLVDVANLENIIVERIKEEVKKNAGAVSFPVEDNNLSTGLVSISSDDYKLSDLKDRVDNNGEIFMREKGHSVVETEIDWDSDQLIITVDKLSSVGRNVKIAVVDFIPPQ